MSQPLVSIVIPTHNRKTMLLRLLKSIFSSTYKNLEIIIVDDASHDGTSEFIRSKYSKNTKLKIIRNRSNLFAAGSRNVGFKKCRGEYIFFIDDDNVVDKNLISRLVKEFLKDPTIGELGPVNYSFLNKKKILWARTRRNMFTSKTNQSRDLKSFEKLKNWETDDVPNAYIVKKSVVKKFNIFFRKEYGIMYEESDYAYRIRKAGYQIRVVRDAKIYHDIENRTPDGRIKGYMWHFMEDKRRPFVFARNRIIFHSIFSTKLEFISIITLWVWLFAIYYIYEILFYTGVGKFSLANKISLAFAYLRGTFNGIYLIISKKKFD